MPDIVLQVTVYKDIPPDSTLPIVSFRAPAVALNPTDIAQEHSVEYDGIVYHCLEDCGAISFIFTGMTWEVTDETTLSRLLVVEELFGKKFADKLADVIGGTTTPNEPIQVTLTEAHQIAHLRSRGFVNVMSS